VKVASGTATSRLPTLSPSLLYVAVSPSPHRFLQLYIAIYNPLTLLYQFHTPPSLHTQYWWCFTPFHLALLVVFPPVPGASLLPRLVNPIRQRSEKKAGAYLPINAPSHQTSTSPPIHRQQTSTLNRQPRNNSSIFRTINIRHGWRQGKIIWRQVVRRQGRSRRWKEAAEPF